MMQVEPSHYGASLGLVVAPLDGARPASGRLESTEANVKTFRASSNIGSGRRALVLCCPTLTQTTPRHMRPRLGRWGAAQMRSNVAGRSNFVSPEVTRVQ
jgi:hypothetical protein